MKNFLVFRESDKVLLRSGRCIEQEFGLQAGEGEYVVEGAVEPGSNYVHDAAAETINGSEDLVSARLKKRDELSASCRADILSGLHSDAHTVGGYYSTGEQDQLNLMQAAVVGGSLWLWDGKNWNTVKHTAAQAAAALVDFVKRRDERCAKLAELIAWISIADSDGIASVEWPTLQG